MELLKCMKDRTPEYDNQYFQMILDFTIEQGGKAGTSTYENRWKQGKYFTTRYDIYIYAALLGLKKNYKIPIAYGTEKSEFIEMRAWQPHDITDYVTHLDQLKGVNGPVNIIEYGAYFCYLKKCRQATRMNWIKYRKLKNVAVRHYYKMFNFSKKMCHRIW